MKTLYITDLDGTFLNSNAEITETSAEIINSLIADGVLFSVASARTKATVLDLFKNISLNTPICLMNGVMIFDVASNKNVLTHNIDKSVASRILDIYKKHGKHPMLYMNKGDYLEIHYTVIDNPHQQEYISNRKNKKLKKFCKVDSYNLSNDDELIYIVSFDKPSELEDIYKEISVFSEVTSSFYADNYTECNFLETMNGSVSKGTSATEIKLLTGADKIVAFGDNLNDIPLFSVADECYAVSNAHKDLKKIATGIIDSNDEDAVARFILNHYKNYNGD